MKCSATENLPRALSLKGDKAFKSLYEQGTTFQTQHLRAFYLTDENLKVGFSVPKRIGKAVQRNLLKRQMREIFRRNKSYFPTQGSLLFIIRQPAEFAVLHREMIDLGRRMMDFNDNPTQ